MHIVYESVLADTVDRKLSKLVDALRHYNLPKLARIFETQCIFTSNAHGATKN